jgi:hypothetical protein
MKLNNERGQNTIEFTVLAVLCYVPGDDRFALYARWQRADPVSQSWLVVHRRSDSEIGNESPLPWH